MCMWMNGQKVGLFKRKELCKGLEYTSVEGRGKQGEKIPGLLAAVLVRCGSTRSGSQHTLDPDDAPCCAKLASVPLYFLLFLVEHFLFMHCD